MAIEDAIRARLQAVSGVTALVSTRCYYLRLPEGATLPAVTYFRVSRVGYPVYSGGPVALATKRMQVDSWAKTGADAVALAEEVRIALNEFSGTVSSVKIDGIFLLDESSGYEPETQLHRIQQDYQVSHQETIT